jgi:glycosyltransferase involved in cell wall biosynthesis
VLPPGLADEWSGWLNPGVPALVSVVIPVYERPELLRRAIQSVLAQTHRPLELVVVDDGSPDDTFKQLQDMRAEVEAAGVTPSFHTKENGGVASARNYGIGKAIGEYITLLDADDRYLPTKVEKELAAVQAEGVDAAVCQVERRVGQVERRVGDKVSLYPGEVSGLLKGHNPAGVMNLKAWAHTNSLFLSRELIQRAGVYDESLRIFEDDEYLIRLAHHGKFSAVAEALATWEDQQDSLSQVPDLKKLLWRDDNRRRQLQLTREKCEGLPGWDEDAWKTSVARWYKQIINHYIWANDLNAAAAWLQEGVNLAGWRPLLKRQRKKLRKARLLGLIGLRVRNPKNDPIYD